jgi:hypothetical protein
MLEACFLFALTMAEPPAVAAPVAAAPVAAAPVAASTPAAAPPAAASAPDVAPSQLPDPKWEEPGLRVTRPGYDLGVSEVHVQKSNGTAYRLSARQWRDVVREDPELWRLHVRGRQFVPGIVLMSVGGVWLAASTAFAMDVAQSESAVARLFQWGLPVTIAVTGVALTIVGGTARRQLHEARRRMYVAPHASRQGGGLAVVGRF